MTSHKRSQYTLGSDLDGNNNEITNTKQVTVDTQLGYGDTTGFFFGDGDTGFYESADDVIRFNIGGALKWTLNSAVLQSAGTAVPSLRISESTATNPVYAFGNDADTGIGLATADQLSLIAGGVEGIRITETGSAISEITMNGDTTFPTKTPASASATGTAGTITWDASYIYVCTATDTWKRVGIATW